MLVASSAPNLADFCLICCTSTNWQQVPALTWRSLRLQVRRTRVAESDLCMTGALRAQHRQLCLCATSHVAAWLHRVQTWNAQGVSGLEPTSTSQQKSPSTPCDCAGAGRPAGCLSCRGALQLLGHHTERLGEARSLLQKALEVSMVSVTLRCCLVLLTSPSSLCGS